MFKHQLVCQQQLLPFLQTFDHTKGSTEKILPLTLFKI